VARSDPPTIGRNRGPTLLGKRSASRAGNIVPFIGPGCVVDHSARANAFFCDGGHRLCWGNALQDALQPSVTNCAQSVLAHWYCVAHWSPGPNQTNLPGLFLSYTSRRDRTSGVDSYFLQTLWRSLLGNSVFYQTFLGEPAMDGFKFVAVRERQKLRPIPLQMQKERPERAVVPGNIGMPVRPSTPFLDDIALVRGPYLSWPSRH